MAKIRKKSASSKKTTPANWLPPQIATTLATSESLKRSNGFAGHAADGLRFGQHAVRIPTGGLDDVADVALGRHDEELVAVDEAVGAHAHRIDAELVQEALDDGAFARQETTTSRDWRRTLRRSRAARAVNRRAGRARSARGRISTDRDGAEDTQIYRRWPGQRSRSGQRVKTNEISVVFPKKARSSRTSRPF